MDVTDFEERLRGHCLRSEMGIPSIIRNVLKCTPKEVAFEDIELGHWFENANNEICIKTDDKGAISANGIRTESGLYIVKPLIVSIKYDYILVDKNGEEYRT